MIILGIETSCDETAAALVEDGTRLLSQEKATSFKSNELMGGVVPDKTAREQLRFILPVISKTLDKAALTSSQIDALAITYGPGLIGSLLIGVETAKTLSLAWNKPLVPINHLVGHIYANWLDTNPPLFPALVLIVSGGHSEIVLMKDHGDFELLGSTRDDAAGECFDKCGRLLGLPYPYGPFIEKEAVKLSPNASSLTISFPRPLKSDPSLDLSFSGLKTAFQTQYRRLVSEGLDPAVFKPLLAHELQEAVVDCLVTKFLRAAEVHPPSSLVLAGGVAANSLLRQNLSAAATELSLPVHIPPLSLCTDNATYIAAAAYFNYQPISPPLLTADPTLNFRSVIHESS